MTKKLRQLLATRQDYIEKMQSILNKADKAKRNLTDAEQVEFNEVKMKLNRINLQIEEQKAKEDEEFSAEATGTRIYGGNGYEIVPESSLIKAKDTKNIRDFRNRFVESREHKDLDFGKFVKGILFNDWTNAQTEFRNATTKVDGSVILPVEIASDIIYAATNRSVLLHNCPILPMNEGTTIIGKVKDNVELDFKEPYALGKETGLGLEGVTLNAKTLYAWIEISEEDLQDIVNLEQIVRNAFGGAVADTLDRNFLYDGTSDPDKAHIYPKGILDNPNILTVEVDTVDYDMVGKAALAISQENGEANTVALNPIEYYALQMLKDNQGQYIQPPTFWNELTKIHSNAIKPNDGLVFDSNQVVIGIRRDMDIKVLPDLKKGTVLLRCMFRADVAAARENHICKIVVNQQ